MVRKVLELRDIVENHVNFEEDTIFKKAQKLLNKEQTNNLKEKMHAKKEKLLNHKEFIKDEVEL